MLSHIHPVLFALNGSNFFHLVLFLLFLYFISGNVKEETHMFEIVVIDGSAGRGEVKTPGKTLDHVLHVVLSRGRCPREEGIINYVCKFDIVIVADIAVSQTFVLLQR